jgi:integrase
MQNWTVKQIQSAKPGRHRVSPSLYLLVPPKGSGRWVFRFTKPGTGRVTEAGLGSADVVTLAEARAKTHDYRRLVQQGQDPIEAKRDTRPATTFGAVASDFIEVQARRYRNQNTTSSVRLMLLTHASALAAMPVSAIGTAHINAALRPLWLRAPDQARRTVAAVLRVIRYAKAQGLCSTSAGDMRDDLAHLLPPTNGTKRHHAAMPYAELPAFCADLRARQDQAMSPAAIEFIVLTASREGEVCGMSWAEVDFAERLWTLPANRSKTNKDHRVPLSNRAVALLERQKSLALGPYVWPSRNGRTHITGKSVYVYLTRGMGIKVTIHGFRAAFSTWCGNETHHDRVTSEMALSHASGNAVELAYRRGDELAKRRALMDAWADYCAGR